MNVLFWMPEKLTNFQKPWKTETIVMEEKKFENYSGPFI